MLIASREDNCQYRSVPFDDNTQSLLWEAARSTSDGTNYYPPSQRRFAAAAHRLGDNSLRRLERPKRGSRIGRFLWSGKIEEVPRLFAVQAASTSALETARPKASHGCGLQRSRQREVAIHEISSNRASLHIGAGLSE